jgi:hypothetical protein
VCRSIKTLREPYTVDVTNADDRPGPRARPGYRAISVTRDSRTTVTRI